MMRMIEYAASDTMMQTLAEVLADQLRVHLRTNPSATLVVPGGTTPGPMFDRLASCPLDWARIFVMLSDERWVPETDPRSNTRLLQARLLKDHAKNATHVPLYLPVAEPEEALSVLQTSVSRHLPISVLLLGMGADMHTASLFPGADRLEDGLAMDAPAVLPMRAAGAPEPRVTLTRAALSSSVHTHVVIIGPEKRQALERAQTLRAPQAPIQVVLDKATVHWAER